METLVAALALGGLALLAGLLVWVVRRTGATTPPRAGDLALVLTRLDGLERGVEQKIENLRWANEQKLESLKATVDVRLREIQAVSEQRLEQVRQTVDEKLQGTLEARLGQSFRQVSERLEAVHKGLGEMQALAAGVGGLKRVLTNVKTRGTWGEVQLETLLPVDAKFPQEDYQRLVEAAEAGDAAGVAAAGSALEVRVKGCARDIATKYLDPPRTTDFGLLFLPTEGLYAEVARRPGLLDGLQREWRVVVAGPATLLALLNSLQMGFRTLAIEKRSSEVWQILGAFKTEFEKFAEVLDDA